ncbi:PASTA domain-containing protein [Tomitella biformata]|uniref:PASTA domain-containing protein n=1 Tax=Tomitella biformata TaxID=630403 RepID=UPI000A06CBBD|nr:PASTA domain-containing protein [Tomitella biformata]
MQKGVLAAALAASAILLAGCGSDTTSVPDVTGYRLDAAHNVLKDAGFKEFEDVDAIESRKPWVDSNWVVIEQNPEAEDQVDPKTTIRLDIAKSDDDGVYDRLPTGSPVYEELREQKKQDEARDKQQQAENKEREKQQQVQDKNDVQEFIDTVDPAARVAQNVIVELNNLVTRISAQGGPTAVDTYNIKDAKGALGTYWDMLEKAPRAINDSADKAQEAIRTFQQAADTLMSAEGFAASSSIARFEQLYDSALIKYNSGLTSLYSGTDVPPPTV